MTPDHSGAAAADSNTRFIILISLVATLGGFLFGFDSGVINGTVDGLRAAFQSDSAGTGFNVASMLLGCAVGAWFAGTLADRYGRRTMLMLSSAFFLISAWGSGIATSSFEFVIYRALGGLAVGAASVMAPAYISEVAVARYRGRLSTIQQIAIISGLFAAFLSNYLLAKVAQSSMSPLWLGYEAWRWMFWAEIIPVVIFGISLFLIPESPRYLVAQRKRDRASAVLNRLYGPAEGQRKLAEIDESLKGDHQPRLSDLIDQASRKIRPIVWVGIGLATFQQLVGINVVFYYGAVLWQAVGFSESDALLINVLSGALSIGACVVTVLLIDKIGRKPLLWFGSLGMALTLGILTVAFASGSLEAGRLTLSDGMGVTALVAANAYVVFFNMSWGPVMWVMLGEMFPNRIRGSGLAVAGLFQWGSNFLITWTFPMLLAGLGLAAAYGLYTLGAALSALFVWRYVHETRGRELEQMEG
ncbi:MAG: sugar porter family MFS transporter [Xanthomonadales bacterium]|nr:sugar porter family MFS transporter [Xanthomonadales bacterium]MCB1635188.1 sugar porter family MFS transporter [Xanthomonadales bacterium]